MADNPFAEFATRGTTVTDTNPFAEFAVGQAGATPAETVQNRFSNFGSDRPVGVVNIGPDAESLGIDFSAPKAEVRRAIAKLPPEVRPVALKEWANRFVANERKGGVGQYVSDVARNLARGTPVGSWLDEANAGTAAYIHGITGGTYGAPYDEAKAYQNALDRAADQDTFKIGTIPQAIPYIGGHEVTGADLTKLAGGIASAPVTPFAAPAAGASMAGNIARGAVAGTSYGALYGAGEGDGATERGVNALAGAGIGAGFGVAAPLISRGVANTVGAVSKARQSIPPEVAPYSRGAVERVSRAVEADRMAPQSVPNVPEVMLADLGPNLKGQAGALANQPGEGQAIITKALTDRRAGAVGRINSAKNKALWTAGGNRGRTNLVELEQRVTKRAQKAAEPFYTQFHNTDIPMTPKLADALTRADAAGAFAGAKKLHEASRAPRTEAAFIDYVKRGVDDLSTKAKASQSFNEHRIYSQLANDLRSAVDEAISPGNPAASAWAQGRKIAGDGLQFRDALEEGGKVFSRGTHPDQLRADLAKMSAIERTGTIYGARGQLDDLIGNASTSMRQNGDTQMLKTLGSEYARDKATQIALRPEAAKKLFDRLDAEANFADTYNQVTQNSKTASRIEAQKEFPTAAEVSKSPDYTGVTLTGMAAQGLRKVIDTLRGGALTAKQVQTSRDAARMLVAQGADRERIIIGLIEFARAKQTTAAQRRAAESIARSLLQAGQSQAVSATASRRGEGI